MSPSATTMLTEMFICTFSTIELYGTEEYTVPGSKYTETWCGSFKEYVDDNEKASSALYFRTVYSPQNFSSLGFISLLWQA